MGISGIIGIGMLVLLFGGFMLIFFVENGLKSTLWAIGGILIFLLYCFIAVYLINGLGTQTSHVIWIK